MDDNSFLSALSGIGDAVGLSSYGRAVTIQLVTDAGAEGRRVGVRLGGPGCPWHVVEVPMLAPLTIEREGTPKLPTRTTELAFATVEAIEANENVMGGPQYAALDFLTAPSMTTGEPIVVGADDADSDDDDDPAQGPPFTVQLRWALGTNATWAPEPELSSDSVMAVPPPPARQAAPGAEAAAALVETESPEARLAPLQMGTDDGAVLQSPSEPSAGLPDSHSASASDAPAEPLVPPPAPAGTSTSSARTGSPGQPAFTFPASTADRSSPSPLRARVAVTAVDDDVSDEDSGRRLRLSRASSNARRRAPPDARRRSTVQMEQLPNMMTPSIDEEVDEVATGEVALPTAMAAPMPIPEVESAGGSSDEAAHEEEEAEEEEQEEEEEEEEPPLFMHQPQRATPNTKVSEPSLHTLPAHEAPPVEPITAATPAVAPPAAARAVVAAPPPPSVQNLFEGAAAASCLAFVEVVQLRARTDVSAARMVSASLHWASGQAEPSEVETAHAPVEEGAYTTVACTRAQASTVPQLSEPFLVVAAAGSPAVMALDCRLDEHYSSATTAATAATTLWTDHQSLLVPVLTAETGWHATSTVWFTAGGDTLEVRLHTTTVHAYREAVLNLRAVDMMEGAAPWLEVVVTPVHVHKNSEAARDAPTTVLGLRCIEPSASDGADFHGHATHTAPVFTAVAPRLPGHMPSAQLVQFAITSPFAFIAVATGSDDTSAEDTTLATTSTVPVRYECLHAWTTEVVARAEGKYAVHYRFATHTSPEPATTSFSARRASVQAPPDAMDDAAAAGVEAVYVLHLRLTPTQPPLAALTPSTTAASASSPAYVALDCAGARVVVVERATDNIVACSDAVRLDAVLRTPDVLPALATQVAFQGLLRRPYVLDCYVLPFDTFSMARLYRPARGGASLAQFEGVLSATIVLNPAALAAAEGPASLTRSTVVLNAQHEANSESRLVAPLCGLSVACAVQRCTYGPSECVFLLRSMRLRAQPVPGLQGTSGKASTTPASATHAQVWFGESVPSTENLVRAWAPSPQSDLDQADVAAAPLRLNDGVPTRLPLWFTTSDAKLRLCVALAHVADQTADDSHADDTTPRTDPVLAAFQDVRARVMRHRKRALRRLEKSASADPRTVAMAVMDDVVMSLDHYLEIDLSPSISAASDVAGQSRRHVLESSVVGCARMNAHEVLEIEGVWLKVPDVVAAQPVPAIYRPSARLWALRCSLVQRATVDDAAPVLEAASFPLDYSDASPEDVQAVLPGVPSDLFIRQRLREQSAHGVADAYSETVATPSESTSEMISVCPSATVQLLYRALLDPARASAAVPSTTSSSSKVSRVLFLFGDAYTTRTYLTLRRAGTGAAPVAAPLPPRPPRGAKSKSTRPPASSSSAASPAASAVMDSLAGMGVVSLTESQMTALFPGISHHRYPPFLEWYQGGLGVDAGVEQTRRDAARARWQSCLVEKDLSPAMTIGALAVRAAIQHPQGAPQLCYHTTTRCAPEGYFVFGGLDARGQPSDRAYFYWSHEQTWTNFDFLSAQIDSAAQQPATNVSAMAVGGPTGRHGHVVVHRPSDRCVYVYGGIGYGGVVATPSSSSSSSTPSAAIGYLSDVWKVRLEDGSVARVEAKAEVLASAGTDTSMHSITESTASAAQARRRYTSPLAASSGPLVLHRWRHTALFHDDYMIVLGGKGLVPRDGAATTPKHGKKSKKGKKDAEVLQEVVCSCAHVLYLDLAAQEWQQRNCYGSDVPCPRYDHAVARQETAMFLYGGRRGTEEDGGAGERKPGSRHTSVLSTDAVEEETLDDLYKLDLVTRLWTRVNANGAVQPPPLAAASLCADKVQRHACLFLVGGTSTTTPAVSDVNHAGGAGPLHVFLFSTETQFWRRIAFEYSALPPRTGLTAAVLVDAAATAEASQRQQQRRARRQRLPCPSPTTQVQVLVVGGAPTALTRGTELHLGPVPLVEGPCVLQLAKPGVSRVASAAAANAAADGAVVAPAATTPHPPVAARDAAFPRVARTPNRPASSPSAVRPARPATAGATRSSLRPARPATAKAARGASASPGAGHTPQPPRTRGRSSGSGSQGAATARAVPTYAFARVYGAAGLGANHPTTSFYTLTSTQQHNLVQRLYYNDTEWRKDRREALEARVYGTQRAASAHPEPASSRAASPQKAPLSARRRHRTKRTRKHRDQSAGKRGRHAQRVLALENPSLLQDGVTSSSSSDMSMSATSGSLARSASSIASVSAKRSASLASSRSSSSPANASYAEDSFETASSSASESSAASSSAAASSHHEAPVVAESSARSSPAASSSAASSSSSANSYVAVPAPVPVEMAPQPDEGGTASAAMNAATELEPSASAPPSHHEDEVTAPRAATPLSAHSSEHAPPTPPSPAAAAQSEDEDDDFENSSSSSSKSSQHSHAEVTAIVPDTPAEAETRAVEPVVVAPEGQPTLPSDTSAAEEAEIEEAEEVEEAEEAEEAEESVASAHEASHEAADEAVVAAESSHASSEPALALSAEEVKEAEEVAEPEPEPEPEVEPEVEAEPEPEPESEAAAESEAEDVYDVDEFEDDDDDSAPAVAPLAPRNASSLGSSHVSSTTPASPAHSEVSDAPVAEDKVSSADHTPTSEPSSVPSTPRAAATPPTEEASSSLHASPAKPASSPASSVASAPAAHSSEDEAPLYEDDWAEAASEKAASEVESQPPHSSSRHSSAAATPATAEVDYDDDDWEREVDEGTPNKAARAVAASADPEESAPASSAPASSAASSVVMHVGPPPPSVPGLQLGQLNAARAAELSSEASEKAPATSSSSASDSDDSARAPTGELAKDTTSEASEPLVVPAARTEQVPRASDVADEWAELDDAAAVPAHTSSSDDSRDTDDSEPALHVEKTATSDDEDEASEPAVGRVKTPSSEEAVANEIADEWVELDEKEAAGGAARAAPAPPSASTHSDDEQDSEPALNLATSSSSDDHEEDAAPTPEAPAPEDADEWAELEEAAPAANEAVAPEEPRASTSSDDDDDTEPALNLATSSSSDDDKDSDAAPTPEALANEVADEWVELDDAAPVLAATEAVAPAPPSPSDDEDNSEPALNLEKSSTSEEAVAAAAIADEWPELDGAAPVVSAQEAVAPVAPAEPSSSDDDEDASQPELNLEKSSTSEDDEAVVAPVPETLANEVADEWAELDDAVTVPTAHEVVVPVAPTPASTSDDDEDSSEPALNLEKSSSSGDDDSDAAPTPAALANEVADEWAELDDAAPPAPAQEAVAPAEPRAPSSDEDESDLPLNLEKGSSSGDDDEAVAAPVPEALTNEVAGEWAELGDAIPVPTAHEVVAPVAVAATTTTTPPASSDNDEDDDNSEPELNLEKSSTSDEAAADEWAELDDAAPPAPAQEAVAPVAPAEPPSSDDDEDASEPELNLEKSSTSEDDEAAPAPDVIASEAADEWAELGDAAPVAEPRAPSSSSDDEREPPLNGEKSATSDDDNHEGDAAPTAEALADDVADQWAELDDAAPVAREVAAPAPPSEDDSAPALNSAKSSSGDDAVAAPVPEAGADEWAELGDATPVLGATEAVAPASSSDEDDTSEPELNLEKSSSSDDADADAAPTAEALADDVADQWAELDDPAPVLAAQDAVAAAPPSDADGIDAPLNLVERSSSSSSSASDLHGGGDEDAAQARVRGLGESSADGDMPGASSAGAFGAGDDWNQSCVEAELRRGGDTPPGTDGALATAAAADLPAIVTYPASPNTNADMDAPLDARQDHSGSTVVVDGPSEGSLQSPTAGAAVSHTPDNDMGLPAALQLLSTAAAADAEKLPTPPPATDTRAPEGEHEEEQEEEAATPEEAASQPADDEEEGEYEWVTEEEEEAAEEAPVVMHDAPERVMAPPQEDGDDDDEEYEWVTEEEEEPAEEAKGDDDNDAEVEEKEEAAVASSSGDDEEEEEEAAAGLALHAPDVIELTPAPPPKGRASPSDDEDADHDVSNQARDAAPGGDDGALYDDDFDF